MPFRRLLPILLPLFLLFAGCAHLPGSRAGASAGVDRYLPRDLPPATSQLLLVLGEEGSSAARLYALERWPGGWRLHLGPLPASVGRNGFAGEGEKREGDGKSPTGLFPLEFVFGYAPSAETAMPYHQATENDLWVDDVSSPDYNRWVRRGETSAASFETMKLSDHRYRHGVVIGYNRNPIRPGRGSAIFLHAWLQEGRPTAGCVAIDEAELVSLIAWLDPAGSPMILMGNAAELAGAAGTRKQAP